MKYLILSVISVCLVSCATTKTQQRRDKVLECTKDLMDMDSGTKESYEVCKDLYSRRQESQK